MQIELKIDDNTIIAPKQIEIEGYHIIDKDDKFIIVIPKNISRDDFEKCGDVLQEFQDDNSQFLLLTSESKVTVLKKGDE